MRISLIVATITWMFCPVSDAQDTATIVSKKRNSRETLLNPKAPDWLAIKDPAELRILEVLDSTDGRIVNDNSFGNLSHFPNVETLVLGCASLTDQGLRHVLELKKLKALVIYKCLITDAGVLQLANLPEIQTIGLFDIAVSANMITALQGRLPKTLVEVGHFNRDGDVFDANGCLTSKFLKKHFRLKEVTPKQDIPFQFRPYSPIPAQCEVERRYSL